MSHWPNGRRLTTEVIFLQALHIFFIFMSFYSIIVHHKAISFLLSSLPDGDATLAWAGFLWTVGPTISKSLRRRVVWGGGQDHRRHHGNARRQEWSKQCFQPEDKLSCRRQGTGLLSITVLWRTKSRFQRNKYGPTKAQRAGRIFTLLDYQHNRRR